jgi:DNA polymerase-3 subunit beta
MGKNLAGETQVLSDGAVFGLRAGNRATTTLEMADEYPKIRGLFPDSTINHFTVDRSELADVISRVSLVAESNEAVRITAAEDLLTVEAGRGEGATGKETIPCELDGDEIEVQFSPIYLGWSLAVTPSERVTLGFQTQVNRPVLIEGHEGLKHLVMPRLSK